MHRIIRSMHADQHHRCELFMSTELGFVPIRIKSGEPGFPGFSVPGRLGGVICKPEGAA